MNLGFYIFRALKENQNLQIVSCDRDFGWAALLNFHKKANPVDPLGLDVMYVLDVLMLLSAESVKNLSDIAQLRPPNSNERGVVEVCLFFSTTCFILVLLGVSAKNYSVQHGFQPPDIFLGSASYD